MFDTHRRYLDPATAPNIPVITNIDWVKERDPSFEVTLASWNRSTDQKIEYTFKCNDMELRTLPLNDDDKEWLRNIGARC